MGGRGQGLWCQGGLKRGLVCGRCRQPPVPVTGLWQAQRTGQVPGGELF